MRVKVIYDKSCTNGMNAGDSAMLDADAAAKVVKTGEAHYETAPKPTKKKGIK